MTAKKILFLNEKKKLDANNLDEENLIDNDGDKEPKLLITLIWGVKMQSLLFLCLFFYFRCTITLSNKFHRILVMSDMHNRSVKIKL